MTYQTVSDLYVSYSRTLLFNVAYRKKLNAAINEASNEEMKLNLAAELKKVNENIQYAKEGRESCRAALNKEPVGELEKMVA